MNKKITSLILLMALLLLDVRSNDNIILYGKNKDKELINMMAANSLVYAMRLSELENDEKKKKFFRKSTFKKIFEYWYATKYLDLPRVRHIDVAIFHFYTISKEATNKGKEMKSCFADPLDAIGDNKTLEIHKSWKFNNKQDYKRLTVEFQDFAKNEKGADE